MTHALATLVRHKHLSCAVVSLHKFTLLKCVDEDQYSMCLYIVQYYCVFVFCAILSAVQVSLLAQSCAVSVCRVCQIEYGHTSS